MSKRSLPALPALPDRRRQRQPPLIGGQAEICEIQNALRQGRCVRFIGPPHHHKSRIMRDACRQMHVEGYASLYVTLWDIPRHADRSRYFAELRDLIATKLRRYVHRRLPRLMGSTSQALRSLLAGLPGLLQNNVALFVDDLEAVPPDILDELLVALRAAYTTTRTGLRFQAVVCAAHSLARTALGPASPFENISALVLSRDLDEADTFALARQLLLPHFSAVTAGALQLIFEQTHGDRCVIGEICQVCCELDRPSCQRLTRPKAQAAAQRVGHAVQAPAFAEGLQQVESDIDLLETVLKLLGQGPQPPNELRFDLAERPNRLITSGFIAHDPVQNVYHLKSLWHARLLAHHFTPERVERLLSAAGKWQSAIDYWGRQAQPVHAAERSSVMHATIGAMYSAETKAQAFAYLSSGLRTAFQEAGFQLYELVKREDGQSLLRPAGEPGLRRGRCIPLDARHPVETLAIEGAREYEQDFDADGQIDLVIPLRLADNHVQGAARVSGFGTERDLSRQIEVVGELLHYLRQSARILQNREEYELLRQAEARRVRIQEQLLGLTKTLTNGDLSFEAVLALVLESAWKVLSPRATGGSIFRFNRPENFLELVEDLGYPRDIRPVRFRPGEGLAGRAFANRRAYNVCDAEHDPRFARVGSAKTLIIRSAVSVPLIGRHAQPLGVLCLDNSERTNAFDAESVRWLKLFAAQVAPWLENLRLMQVLRDLNATVADVRNLWSPDPHQFYERLMQRLVSTFHVSGGAIGLRSAATGYLTFVAVNEMPGLPHSLPVDELPRRLRHDLLEQGQHLLLTNPSAEGPEWERLAGRPGPASLLAVPLHSAQEDNSGLLLLVSAGRFEPSPEELKILMSFAAQVTLVLENARPINPHIVFQGRSALRLEETARWIHEHESPDLSAEALLPQIYELMGVLFRKADKLLVHRADQGMSGSVVLHVEPTLRQGSVGKRLIVKIGTKVKTRHEEEHYDESVEPYVQYHHAHKLNTHYTPDLGGLLYTIASPEQGLNPVPLSEFFRRRPSGEIVQALQNLFRTTCRLWYSNTRQRRQMANLRDLYLDAFELTQQPNRLRTELAELWPTADWSSPSLEFPTLNAVYRNPLAYLEDDDEFLLPVCQSVTHGDLNANNILVDGTNACWLIDFYRTYESHILRDFVILETDLKFRLAPTVTLAQFHAMEAALCGLGNPEETGELSQRVPEPLRKLADVIVGIRSEAWSLLGSLDPVGTQEAWREYMLSLLMGTLNVIRLRYFKEKAEYRPRREMALLSAAMICQYLAESPVA